MKKKTSGESSYLSFAIPRSKSGLRGKMRKMAQKKNGTPRGGYT